MAEASAGNMFAREGKSRGLVVLAVLSLPRGRLHFHYLTHLPAGPLLGAAIQSLKLKLMSRWSTLKPLRSYGSSITTLKLRPVDVASSGPVCEFA